MPLIIKKNVIENFLCDLMLRKAIMSPVNSLPYLLKNVSFKINILNKIAMIESGS